MNDHSRLRVVEERNRLPTDALRAISHRLGGYRNFVDLEAGWERGVPGDWLDALLGDWRDFDTDALPKLARRISPDTRAAHRAPLRVLPP